jgi:hypothetical protein
MPDISNVEQRHTKDTSASRSTGWNVALMIGAILVAATIVIVVVVFVRQLRDRPKQTVTPPPATDQTEAAIDAADILARMRTVYASLESYQDSGLIIERQISKNVLHHTRGMFSTTYRKPCSVAFHLQPIVEYETREWYWIMMDADRFESRKSGVSTGHSSISAALASLTDKSLGATLCALPLLISVPDLDRLDDMRMPEYVGVGNVEGHACYKIRGELGDRSVVLWIDQKQLLIREVEFDDGSFMIIITPDVNTTIANDAFAAPPSLPDGRR